MSGGDPSRIGGRFVDACIGVLLATMALYGAVSILRAIWLYLCVIVLVVGIAAFMWWWIARQFRGW